MSGQSDPRPRLQLILASTRPERACAPIGAWVEASARAHGGFDVELVDLKEVDLPMMNEPHHPRLRQYTLESTKAWSARIDPADAFVFVTPEYNYGFTAPLKNAIDHLVHEWAFKPVAFVSYGGVAAGTRAVQMLKQVVTTLKMTPVLESVNIPWFPNFIREGRFEADEGLGKAAVDMLDELQRWERALREMRQAARQAR